MNPLGIFMAGPLMVTAVLFTGLAAAGVEGSDLAMARTQQQQQQQATTQDAGGALSIQAYPQSLLLKAGEPALFRVTGVRGSASFPLRYQWRRNGVDIEGAVKTWLKLDHVSLADDGSRYTVLVSAGAASAESKPCALRVVDAAAALSDD